jgi:fermentation-respiration switch protein FrsA (DUF1100 family)
MVHRTGGGEMTILLYVALGVAALIVAFFIELAIVAFILPMKVPKQTMRLPSRPREEKERERPAGRRDVVFAVKGSPISAWLYLPEDLSSPVPCVVMAHGLGGTKDMLLDDYARQYRGAGLAALAFDYRYFGTSSGEPRQLAWIPHQQEDCSAAVEYVRGLSEIDPMRIALWGTSLGGGHVIVTAARDPKIACVCAQVPLLHGSAGAFEVLKRVGLRHALRTVAHGQRDLVRSWFGLPPHRIPYVGRPGTLAMIADAEVWGTFGPLASSSFVNELCARIAIRMDKYRPINYMGKVRCPVLLQVCDKDIGLPMSVVRKAERRLGALAEVIHYPIDHFDVYQGANFDRAVSDQLAFFRKHLLQPNHGTRA